MAATIAPAQLASDALGVACTFCGSTTNNPCTNARMVTPTPHVGRVMAARGRGVARQLDATELAYDQWAREQRRALRGR